MSVIELANTAVPGEYTLEEEVRLSPAYTAATLPFCERKTGRFR